MTTTTATTRAERQRPLAQPLIRETADGWERLEVGTAKAPVYTPYAWDDAAWEARQRRAEAIRAGSCWRCR